MNNDEKRYMNPTALAVCGLKGGPLIRMSREEYAAMHSRENYEKMMNEYVTKVIESYKARDEAAKLRSDTSLEKEEKEPIYLYLRVLG